MTILNSLLDQRAAVHAQATAHLDTLEAQGRDLTGDAKTTFDRYNTELDTLDRRISEVKDLTARERVADEARARGHDLARRQSSTDARPDSRDLVLPSWSEYRALSEGTASAGGYLVPTQQASVWFDLLRRQSVFLAAGPRVLDVTTDRLEVPKIGASVTAAMVAENAQITPADPTFEQVVLTPKKLAALTLVSNEALADSNPGLREVVQADHIATMATTLDAQFLAGSGSGANIRGVRNLSGVTVTALDTNGRAPSLDDMADAIGRLEVENSTARLAVFMHARTWGVYRKLKDADNRNFLSPDPTADARRQLFGVPVYISNAISITETVGSSNDCSWIGVVDMDRLAVGRRQAIQVDYSADYKFDYDQTAIRSVSRWDLGLLDEESVEILTGVRT